VDVMSLDNGVGSVHLDPLPLDCTNAPGQTGSCSQMYRIGTTVSLSMNPDVMSVFEGWGGACAPSGTAPTCTVTVTDDTYVSTAFHGPQALAVKVDGATYGDGGGMVRFDPPLFECATPAGVTTRCEQPYRLGTVVTLVPWPDGDSRFAGWGGAGPCSGTGACQVTVSAPGPLPEITALFRKRNYAPVANAGGPYSGVRGAAVAMDGSQSSDADGDALTYTWEFGDGATGSGAAPTHVYASVGTFSVRLTVADGRGGTNVATTSAVVSNRAPAANAGGPYSGVRNQPITFTGAGSTDPDGDALSYTWAFGDSASATGGDLYRRAHR
jgi:hypothetical protein